MHHAVPLAIAELLVRTIVQQLRHKSIAWFFYSSAASVLLMYDLFSIVHICCVEKLCVFMCMRKLV